MKVNIGFQGERNHEKVLQINLDTEYIKDKFKIVSSLRYC